MRDKFSLLYPPKPLSPPNSLSLTIKIFWDLWAPASNPSPQNLLHLLSKFL